MGKLAIRWAHNPEIVRSSRTSATSNARLAHLVERSTCNADVVSSKPTPGTTYCPGGGTEYTAVLEAAAERIESSNLSLGTKIV